MKDLHSGIGIIYILRVPAEYDSWEFTTRTFLKDSPTDKMSKGKLLLRYCPTQPPYDALSYAQSSFSRCMYMMHGLLKAEVDVSQIYTRSHSSAVMSSKSRSRRIRSPGSSRSSTPGPTDLDVRPLGNICKSIVSALL